MKRRNRGRAPSDIRDLVAGDAPIRAGTAQRCMAGEAVRFKVGVRWNQRSRRHHEVRIQKRQRGYSNKIDRDKQENPPPLHLHPQNRKILTM